MSNLIMMVGLPGSGKSTYINWKMNKEKDLVLSTDKIITEIAAHYDFTYEQAFKLLFAFAEKVMYVELERWLSKGTGGDVYWDQTNLSYKSRERKLNKFRLILEKVNSSRSEKLVFGKVAMHVDTPFGVCAARQSTREDKNISLETLTDMAKQFQHPMIEEGFDLIAHPTTDGHNVLG